MIIQIQRKLFIFLFIHLKIKIDSKLDCAVEKSWDSESTKHMWLTYFESSPVNRLEERKDD